MRYSCLESNTGSKLLLALSASQYDTVMHPFRIIFKSSSRLVRSLPNEILHSRSLLGVISLYQRSLTNFVSFFTKLLSFDMDHFLSRSLYHRFHYLEYVANIPHSILLVEDYSSFIKLKVFKHDFIFRFLYYCSLFNIRFSNSLVTSSLSYSSPLYSFFRDYPALFASQASSST